METIKFKAQPMTKGQGFADVLIYLNEDRTIKQVYTLKKNTLLRIVQDFDDVELSWDKKSKLEKTEFSQKYTKPY